MKLSREWVQAAMFDEIEFLNQQVRHGVPLSTALADPGPKVIGTRWVLNNKGDANEPDARAPGRPGNCSTATHPSSLPPHRWSRSACCCRIGRQSAQEEEHP